MQGELGVWLASLEDERRAANRKGLVRLAFTLPVVLGALLFSLVALDGNWLNKILGTLAILAFVYMWAQAPARALMPAVKIETNTEIARAMKLEYQAYPNANFAYECGTYFGLLPVHDKAEFEDLWIGEFDERAFELIEVHLQKRQERGNKRHWSNVFRGALLSIRTRSQFKGATLIREKDDLRDWSETYLLNSPASPIELGMAPVPTSNADFDGRFECYSEDPEEAKRLITPQVISEINRMEGLFGAGRHTSAIFHDGYFVLIIESGNLFEGSSHGTPNDHEAIASTIEQFARIAEVAKAV